MLCFFFFKQKTAYEMRISDWSSDVCSSDLFRGTRPVGLVDDEDVGDLEEAGLARLDSVAPAGVHDDDGRVSSAGDVHLDLPDADRLHDDPRDRKSVV